MAYWLAYLIYFISISYMENAYAVEPCASIDNEKNNISDMSNILDIVFYLNRPLTNEEKVLVRISICDICIC